LSKGIVAEFHIDAPGFLGATFIR